jgi:proline racemase
MIESILGTASVFRGKVVEHTQFGPYSAIVPEVGGSAYIAGRNEWILDQCDPLGWGFLLF